MANNLTNYLEDALIKHALGITAFTMPATVRLALFTADPTEAGTLTNEVTTTDSAYARQAVTWDTVSNGSTSNSAEIVFPQATASWGTISHVGIMDGSTAGAGNMLLYGPLAATKTIASTDQFKMAAAALAAVLD